MRHSRVIKICLAISVTLLTISTTDANSAGRKRSRSGVSKPSESRASKTRPQKKASSETSGNSNGTSELSQQEEEEVIRWTGEFLNGEKPQPKSPSLRQLLNSRNIIKAFVPETSNLRKFERLVDYQIDLSNLETFSKKRISSKKPIDFYEAQGKQDIELLSIYYVLKRTKGPRLDMAIETLQKRLAQNNNNPIEQEQIANALNILKTYKFIRSPDSGDEWLEALMNLDDDEFKELFWGGKTAALSWPLLAKQSKLMSIVEKVDQYIEKALPYDGQSNSIIFSLLNNPEATRELGTSATKPQIARTLKKLMKDDYDQPVKLNISLEAQFGNTKS